MEVSFHNESCACVQLSSPCRDRRAELIDIQVSTVPSSSSSPTMCCRVAAVKDCVDAWGWGNHVIAWSCSLIFTLLSFIYISMETSEKAFSGLSCISSYIILVWGFFSNWEWLTSQLLISDRNIFSALFSVLASIRRKGRGVYSRDDTVKSGQGSSIVLKKQEVN